MKWEIVPSILFQAEISFFIDFILNMQYVYQILRDNTMADKMMYNPNDDTQNKPFCRLKFLVKTFGHLTK